MLKVLFYSDAQANPENDPDRTTLLNFLVSTGQLDITLTANLPAPAYLANFQGLVLAGGPTLSTEEAETLVGFVRRGGGLVALGRSSDQWANSEPLRQAFELKSPAPRSPHTELIVRVPATSRHVLTQNLSAGYAHDHYAGLDLDTAFALTDSFSRLSAGRAEELLQVSWQGERLPVAWTRPYGEGRVFWTSLGAASSSWASPVFGQLVYRAIRHSAGQLPASGSVGIAMIGYGAIGQEHATAIQQVNGLHLVGVCDRNPARVAEATRLFEGIKTFDSVQAVLDDPVVDLAIISTPPNLHASMALQLLEAGKHVVVEKPFCLTTREADAMIDKAAALNRTLSVYQCRRWDPDYLAIKALVDSDQIGEVFHLETFIGTFSHPCDYWHSHEPVSGGVFYDWGSHYLDWILGLMPGRVSSVSGFSHKRVWLDVTNEDQARLVLHFEDGREAEFIHSDIAAALKPKWYVLGSKGAVVGNWRTESVKTRRWSGDLIEEHLAPSEALPDLTAYIRQSNGLINEQRLALPPAPVFPFHRNLANHILLGEPLAVLPTQSRRNIAIMEAAKKSATMSGQFIPVEPV